MELLSVAQKYKMDVVLTHIRDHIGRQDPSFLRKETAFLVYSLAQKYGLRHEALNAARSTLSFSTLTIKDLYRNNKLSMMPGDALHELWKYHQRVRSNLSLGLEEFETSTQFDEAEKLLREKHLCRDPSFNGHFFTVIVDSEGQPFIVGLRDGVEHLGTIAGMDPHTASLPDPASFVIVENPKPDKSVQ